MTALAAGVSVIVPAHNEADYIGACLAALFASERTGLAQEAIVVANGCTDATARVVRGYEAQARAAGWRLMVIDSAEGGKPLALTLGDAAARGDILVYLDADVLVSPPLIRALADALAGEGPRYASGTPVVSRSPSAITRAYARIWTRLPFLAVGAPGFGLFAMSRAGRARWGDWPRIIADDTFARLNFAPGERAQVSETYEWPLVEGFRSLVRVRRRQDAGNREVAQKFPALRANDDVWRLGNGGALRLFLRDPLGMAVYAAVKFAVRLPGADGWVRGR